MVEAAADAGAVGRHDDDGHVVAAGGGPALVAGQLQHVERIEGVVAELDFADGPAAGVGDAHRGAEDAAFVERGIPGGLEPLRGGEDAAERRADVLAEHIGDAEMRLAVMQRHADGLDECGHDDVLFAIEHRMPRMPHCQYTDLASCAIPAGSYFSFTRVYDSVTLSTSEVHCSSVSVSLLMMYA